MHRARNAFTIIELLVVISIIALLISILLPAVGKARDNAKVAVSRSNLRQLGVAMHQYSADWEDRQYQVAVDTLASYGSVATYNSEVYNDGSDTDNPFLRHWHVHPGIPAGWSYDGFMYGYWMDYAGHHWAVEPIHFTGGAAYFGWFRFPQTKPIHNYLGGRFYEQVYYAPKDRMSLAASEPCMDDPGEFTVSVAECNPPIWSSYCFSPAANFNPACFRPEPEGGWLSAWDLPSGFRSPSMGQIRYPDLKTHLLEHQWLQNVEVKCNSAFDPFSSVLDCEPYYFNHALTSSPVTLFYDMHVGLVGVHEAMLADRRHDRQFGYGLWSRDTPFGEDGYMINVGYDFAATSFHILTTEGAFGRDILGKE